MIPGSGRSPGEGDGNPLQYSCLENPMDREVWQTTVHGVTRVRRDLMTKPTTKKCIEKKKNMKNYSGIVLAFGVTQVSNISFLSSGYHSPIPLTPVYLFCFYFFCLKRLIQENTDTIYISILPCSFP